MFIIAVLNLIKIYQTRHADINPHSARTFSFLAMIIFITVIGVVCEINSFKTIENFDFIFQYYDQQWFWISYAIVHIIICFMFTTKIYYMGRLKLSLRVHVRLKLYFLLILPSS
jgi:hypothetical protein